MGMGQWTKSRRRKPQTRRTQLNVDRLSYEPLEDRRMLTLLGIAPVLLPSMTYDSTGHIQYTASADTFDLTATPLTFRNVSGPPRNFTGAGSLALHILVDNSGNLISGTPGNDFEIDGTVTPTGNVADTVTGMLLTGEVLGFGYLEAGSTDQYDLRFQVTGGQLASYFAGHDIGMTVGSENSTFNDDFSVDFQGGAKGNVGNIMPLGSPTVTTNASASDAAEVGVALLSDSATISGGDNVSGGASDFHADRAGQHHQTVAVGSGLGHRDLQRSQRVGHRSRHLHLARQLQRRQWQLRRDQTTAPTNR